MSMMLNVAFVRHCLPLCVIVVIDAGQQCVQHDLVHLASGIKILKVVKKSSKILLSQSNIHLKPGNVNDFDTPTAHYQVI